MRGVSKPVNKRLFEIFKTCGFVEESGHGVPTVTKAYGDESYIFDGKFVKVVSPFDRSGFTNTTQEIDNTTQKTTQGHESTTQKTTQETLDTTKETTKKDENTTKKATKEKIIELLRNNPNLSRSDLSVILKLSEDGIQYHLNDLKKKGIIKRVGPDKGGHWEVKE